MERSLARADATTSPTTPIVDADRDARVVGIAVGRYLVVAEVGHGGMGVVLRAYDPKLRREVALKRLHPSGSVDRAQARLLREARAMAKLSHPHVVAVYDVEETIDDAFVVMEYVEGATLRQWLEERTRPWPEILDVLVQCARGLAAAHAVGLVHRDFKPTNVLVTPSGQAKVMDFGLARSAAELPSNRSSAELAPLERDEVLTRGDTVMGTPGYMAPEQHDGEAADARADQYALCVTLWEALWGQRPFSGDMNTLAQAKRQGAPAVPRGSHVPAWLADAVRRGLAPRAEDRHRDVEALLIALQRGRARAGRKRIWIACSVLALVGAGAWAVKQLDERRTRAGCDALGGEIEVVWNDGVRDRVAAGLNATGAIGADVTAGKIGPRFDEFARTWRDARTEACVATRLDRRMDEPTFERTEWCLEEARLQLGALVEELAAADSATVYEAVPTASRLPAPAACLETDVVARRPLPRPEARGAVLELRAELSRATALARAGKGEEARTRLTEIVAEADALDWPPVAALARYELAGVEGDLGRYAEAEPILRDAYFVAMRGGAFDIAASAANGLTYTVGDLLGRPDDGLQWSEHAALALDAAGETESPRRSVHFNNVAMIYMKQGRFEEAEALHLQALAMREHLYGTESPYAALSYNNLGNTYRRAGDLPRAKAMYERALELRERALGSDHPLVARTLNNLAGYYHEAGEPDLARATWERALAIKERTLGVGHPETEKTRSNLGTYYLQAGDLEHAESLIRTALPQIEAAVGPNHPDLAASVGSLGNVLVAQGRFAEAQPLFERMVAIKRNTPPSADGTLAGAEAELAANLLALGRLDEALEVAQRSVDAFAVVGPGGKDERAMAEFLFARISWEQGSDRPRALALAKAARKQLVGGDLRMLAEMDAWIAAR